MLYFDGAYVYSTNAQSLIRYLVKFTNPDNAPKPIAEITMVAHIDEPVMSIIDPEMRERTWMAFYYYPSDVTFESASFGSGRIMNAAARDNSTYTYQYFITDHLGSTRMVVDGNGVPLEATEYYPYGTKVPVTPSANPEVPAREQFTGKEFDTEGEDVANGAPGIQCYYFGARYYDPEVGVWGSCDKAGQFASGYGYGTSPVIKVDEDGNFIFIPILIGAAIGAYQGYQIGKAQGAYGGSLLVSTLFGAGVGAFAGGFGSAIAGAGFIGSGIVGTATSSTINSLGSYALTNKESGLSTNFGFGSMNWSKGSFSLNNPFEQGKNGLQRTMDLGGWLTVGSDIYKAPGQIKNMQIDAKYGKGMSKMWNAFDDAKQSSKSNTFGKWSASNEMKQSFTGPGPNASSTELEMFKNMADAGVRGIAKNRADYAAIIHDLRYTQAGAYGGAMSVVTDVNVLGADLELVGRNMINIATGQGCIWDIGFIPFSITSYLKTIGEIGKYEYEY